GLAGISCGAPGACVAIGDYAVEDSPDHGTLLTEGAGKWRRGVEPALPRGAHGHAGTDVSAVSCASAGNSTVAGSYNGVVGQSGLLLTEIAGRWARGVRAPQFTDSFGSVVSVSCASPGDCGAVGVGWWNPGDSPSYVVLFDSTTPPCVVPTL